MSIKVVHIESGLGNQMLSFCELLALKESNPQDQFYIETLVYDFPECNEITCQWNGYELEKIFKVQVPNVSSLFSDKEWNTIKKEIHDTKFWEKNWNYPKYFTEVFAKHGLKLINLKGDYEKPGNPKYDDRHRSKIQNCLRFLKNKTIFGAWLKQKWRTYNPQKYEFLYANPRKLYLSTPESVFTGLWLRFKFKGNEIERIHSQILSTFLFPPFENEINISFANLLDKSNSVFIHARRGDMLGTNNWCYKYGFFKRAVKHIKDNVENPFFVFFTNTGSIEWCKEHVKDIFGLNAKDNIAFVDWNNGEESYRDMQLMTHCKHGIITNSTFGWWGAYLIPNPNKITISPMYEINTTHTC